MFNSSSRWPSRSIARFSIGVLPAHQTARPLPIRENQTTASAPSAYNGTYRGPSRPGAHPEVIEMAGAPADNGDGKPVLYMRGCADD